MNFKLVYALNLIETFLWIWKVLHLIFSPISEYFWIPEDGLEQMNFIVGHFHSVSLQSSVSSAQTFLSSSSLRVLIISASTSSYGASRPRCWRQTTTKELPGRTIWLLINSSRLGLSLCCSAGNPSTSTQERLENKQATTTNNENLQFFGSL